MKQSTQKLDAIHELGSLQHWAEQVTVNKPKLKKVCPTLMMLIVLMIHHYSDHFSTGLSLISCPPLFHIFFLSSLFHDMLCSCLYSVSSSSHCFISAVLNSDHILQNCSRCLVVGMLCPSPFQSLIKILTRTGPRIDAKTYKTLLILHAYVSSPVFMKKK